jgi:hypothetical protein
MTEPREDPFGAVRLADVLIVTDLDPDYPDATDGDFHLVRRDLDILAVGGPPGAAFHPSRWEQDLP